jgi:hypothetical protein
LDSVRGHGTQTVNQIKRQGEIAQQALGLLRVKLDPREGCEPFDILDFEIGHVIKGLR